MNWAAILTTALVKALVMTGTVATLATAEPFWHQLVIVLVSAVVSGLGMIAAALISARRVEHRLDDTHQAVADLKRSQGVAKRATDET